VLTEARLAEARGERKVAVEGYQRAFEMGRRIHSQDVEFESIVSWSKFAELSRGPEVALRVVQNALPGARQSGRMDLVFNLRLVRARAYADSGRDDLAESEVEATRLEAESLGYLNQLTYALSGLTALAIGREEWSKGANYAKQACDLAERLGNNPALGHTLALLSSLEIRQASKGGSVQLLYDAVEHGRRSVDVLARVPPSDSLVYAHAYLAEAYVGLHKPSEALDHYRQALENAENLGLVVLRQRIAMELEEKVRGAQSPGTDDSSPPARE